MERVEFVQLWDACGKSILGPIAGTVIRTLPLELLEDLAMYKIIIGRFSLPESVKPHEYLLEHELDINNFNGLSVFIKKEGKMQVWLHKHEIEPSPLEGLLGIGALGTKGSILKSAMRCGLENYIYIIDCRCLAFYIAKDWGLTHVFAYAPPDGFNIGYYQDKHPVVILSDVNQQRILQALEIKKNISADNLIVITTKTLKLTEQEKVRLYSEKIIYLTILNFISPENTLRWDLIDFGKCTLGDDVFKHSPDYRTIIWQGCKYKLTATQAACMKELYESHVNGASEIGQAYVLECTGS